MNKIRLNKSMREDLMSFAKENCKTPNAKTVQKAYDKALTLVVKDVTSKYPIEDMKVLSKYGKSTLDDCLLGYGDNGQALRFVTKEDDALTVPSGYCKSRSYKWSDRTAKAIEDYNFLISQEKEDMLEIIRDYQALINNYTTVDDLLEIWPSAVEVLQGYIDASNRNLPATLSNDALERIKKSNISSSSD